MLDDLRAVVCKCGHFCRVLHTTKYIQIYIATQSASSRRPMAIFLRAVIGSSCTTLLSLCTCAIRRDIVRSTQRHTLYARRHEGTPQRKNKHARKHARMLKCTQYHHQFLPRNSLPPDNYSHIDSITSDIFRAPESASSSLSERLRTIRGESLSI